MSHPKIRRSALAAVTATTLAAAVLAANHNGRVTPRSVDSAHRLADFSVPTDPAYIPLPDGAYDAVGVKLDPLTGPSSLLSSIVTPEAALSAALADAGDLVSGATGAAVSFGSFSDDSYYTTDAQGIKHYVAQGLPAFVVTFSGISMPPVSGDGPSNSEESVVIDAQSGSSVETFSFR